MKRQCTSNEQPSLPLDLLAVAMALAIAGGIIWGVAQLVQS